MVYIFFYWKNATNWHKYSIFIINLLYLNNIIIFNDIIFYIFTYMNIFIFQLNWNYDTQPYVPYTVLSNIIVKIFKNQMYKVQYAFNLSMIMCSAIHMATRSLLRSSSTHEPSDPLSRVSYIKFSFFLCLITTFVFFYSMYYSTKKA